MRKLLLLQIVTILFSELFAQSPQFAVVRPDGTTFICPTWDSAYNKSVNGDYIYLPGGTFLTSSEFTISKKLFIYGAGHHPDSTLTTGITTFLQPIRLVKGADQGSIEGINFINAVYFGTGITGNNKANVQFYTIKRCFITSLYFTASVIVTNVDSLPSNILVTENVLSTSFPSSSNVRAINNQFTKNIISGALTMFEGCNFSNNVFLLTGGTGQPLNEIRNSTFSNNIFCTGASVQSCSNTFNNNLKVNPPTFLSGCSPGDGSQFNTIVVSAVSDIFLSYTAGAPFSYSADFRLKPTCPGVNAGTDGTDVGIYGTTSPTSIGWVPSNPHIYFKSVAPQTNSSGQLPIQFKVRTTN